MRIEKIKEIPKGSSLLIVCRNPSKLDGYGLNPAEVKFIKTLFTDGKHWAIVNQYSRYVFVCFAKEKSDSSYELESCRKSGTKIAKLINKYGLKVVAVVDSTGLKKHTTAVIEGIILSSYEFLKYKTGNSKKGNSLKSVQVLSSKITEDDTLRLQSSLEGACFARDLVNEPLSFLTAKQLPKEISNAAKNTGLKVTVLEKVAIKSLGMGGLLAVNKGSVDPPTFTILEWKPRGVKNKKPYVLVGKGVVFDTGGMNLKTFAGMKDMKADMGGAAAVAGTMYAIAAAKLPVHVIGLIPATDNRVDGNAHVPGDVIKMHDGTLVEILNTDAEGRLILADALSYAKKYKPELVIDLATLTGSAVAAFGTHGIPCMATAGKKEVSSLDDAGMEVYERIAQMPLWREYGDMIKSEIAEIKNIGGPYAGTITAGKFLEHFTDYPWIHLDIAGPAFIDECSAYRPKGGTGVGVRLLFNFLSRKAGK